MFFCFPDDTFSDTKLGVGMSAEADGVTFAPRARAAEQNFPGKKHGKVIFVVQRSEAGFLGFFRYLSLSLRLFVRSQLTIM